MCSNYLQVSFEAKSVNEGVARMIAAAFMTPMNPTLEQMEDVKTAVSEAVTNAIIHAGLSEEELVHMECRQEERLLEIVVSDHGIGILDIGQARTPFYTSRPQEERSGMGFAFMETFMDEVLVESTPGKGTRVTLRVRL